MPQARQAPEQRKAAAQAAKERAVREAGSEGDRPQRAQAAVNSAHYTPNVQRALSGIEPALTRIYNRERIYALHQRSGRTLLDTDTLPGARQRHNRGEANTSETNLKRTRATGHAVNIPAEQAGKLYRAVITHNHPVDVSFSAQDVETAARFSAHAIRAVTPQATYELRPNPQARPGNKGWNDPWWQTRGKALYAEAEKNAIRSLNAQIRAHQISREEAKLTRYHATAQEFARLSEGRFLYTRVAHNGQARPVGTRFDPSVPEDTSLRRKAVRSTTPHASQSRGTQPRGVRPPKPAGGGEPHQKAARAPASRQQHQGNEGEELLHALKHSFHQAERAIGRVHKHS